MKILHTVESYYPSVGGMQEVVKQLSERLAALKHDVTVATSKRPDRDFTELNGVKIAEFAVGGNEVRGITGEVGRYTDFLVNSDFDVITNFAAQQWATDSALAVLDRIKAKKVFVPTGFSGLYDRRYVDYFERMKDLMKKYDMNVFLSDDYRDVNFAKANNVEKRGLIPNGAGADEFLPASTFDVRARLGIPKDDLLILHVGSHTGVKGHREAIQLFRQANIGPATLLIIGNEYPRSGCARRCHLAVTISKLPLVGLQPGKQLLVRDLSRAETVAAYKAADLFLFPSNIECSPIVLFECMAAMLPFLTSEAGNAKEIVSWSGAGVVMPTVTEQGGYALGYVTIKPAVRMLEELAADGPRRQALGAAGFKAWQERFSWEKIARDYEALYLSLVENR